jgi:hypothetical protein
MVVPTCIGCGSRVRWETCPEGCDDVALDLVAVADLEAMTAALWAWQDRVAALAGAARALASADGTADALRTRAAAALRTPAP